MFDLQTVCFFSSLLFLACCQDNTSSPGRNEVGAPDYGLRYPVERSTGTVPGGVVTVPEVNWDPINDVPLWTTTEEIIDGENAVYGDHPYHCALMLFFEGFIFYTCGCVVYNEYTIVTAAHCITVIEGPRQVWCGVNDLRAPRDEFEVRINVSTIINHPNYLAEPRFGVGVPYDVSVLHLESPLVFNDYVRPAPLYDGVSRIPRDCVLTGWGLTSDTSGISPVLQKTTARYLTRARCQHLFDEVGSVGITDLNACFLNLEGMPNDPTCSGDSGGPVVCGGVLVGVVSWGRFSCETPYPTVYTTIAQFKTWIEDNALPPLKRRTVVG